MSGSDESSGERVPQFAYVKYDPRWGEDKEIVQVKNIRVQPDPYNQACRTPYKPQHNMDFKSDMWYVVRTKKRTKNSKEINAWALIGKLHGTLNGMTKIISKEGKGNRITFPPLDAPDVEPDTTDEELQPVTSVVNSIRKNRLNNKRKKRDNEINDMETYMRNSAISENISTDNPVSADKEQEQECSPIMNNSLSEPESSSNLTESVKSTDSNPPQSIKPTNEDRNSSFSSETSLQSSILNLMTMIKDLKDEFSDIKSFREEFNDMKKQMENCSSKVEKMSENIIEVQQSIRSSTAHSVSGQSAASSPEEKVEWLGLNGEKSDIYIRKCKLEQMQFVEKECEWANLFLEGCFDEDKVQHMRCTTRKNGDPNSIPIPKKTLSWAKNRFADWLSRKGNDSNYVSARRAVFGTTVGAAALAHGPKRGLAGKLERAQEAGDEELIREVTAKMREAAQKRVSSPSTRGYDHHNATPANRRGGLTGESALTSPSATTPAVATPQWQSPPVSSPPTPLVERWPLSKSTTERFLQENPGTSNTMRVLSPAEF